MFSICRYIGIYFVYIKIIYILRSIHLIGLIGFNGPSVIDARLKYLLTVHLFSTYGKWKILIYRLVNPTTIRYLNQTYILVNSVNPDPIWYDYSNDKISCDKYFNILINLVEWIPTISKYVDSFSSCFRGVSM